MSGSGLPADTTGLPMQARREYVAASRYGRPDGEHRRAVEFANALVRRADEPDAGIRTLDDRR
jgi:hypothetical protein